MDYQGTRIQISSTDCVEFERRTRGCLVKIEDDAFGGPNRALDHSLPRVIVNTEGRNSPLAFQKGHVVGMLAGYRGEQIRRVREGHPDVAVQSFGVDVSYRAAN